DLGSGTAAGHFTRAHEYILVFAKEKISLKNFSYSGEADIISERAVKKISKGNPASQITFPSGIYFEGKEAKFEGLIGRSEKIKIVEGKLEFKDGKLLNEVTLEAGWAMRDQILSWLAGEETYDSKGQKVLRFYFSKKGVLQYEKERGVVNPPSVLRKIASTKKGTEEIDELFGAKIMDFPKPSALLKYLYSVVTNNNDIVLDFFAGSGTTAQAVLELNKEDGGNRKFILVQLPEKIAEDSEAYKAGYKTIADICKERIRRVINRLNHDSAGLKDEQDKLQEILFKNTENPESTNNKVTDNGFKVFRLTPSNFKHWRSDLIESEEDLGKMMDIFDSQLKPGAQEKNMLYELMLKSGYTLTDKIDERNGYYLVADKLAVVLEKVDETIIREIINSKPQTCIILDNLFAGNDQLKTNTGLQMKDAGVELITI